MDGFIKYIRSEDAQHLHSNKNANHLLNIIAYRASRNGNPVKNLKPGESLIGDFKAIGLSRQEYRTAADNLAKWGYITIRTTNAGTIAKLCNSNVYDINSKASNQQDNHRATIEQPSSNHRTTTIKKERKKERKNKEGKFDFNSKRLKKIEMELNDTHQLNTLKMLHNNASLNKYFLKWIIYKEVDINKIDIVNLQLRTFLNRLKEYPAAAIIAASDRTFMNRCLYLWRTWVFFHFHWSLFLKVIA